MIFLSRLRVVVQTSQIKMTNKSPRVYIFQPVVPQYRLGFFEELNRCLRGNLTVCASQNVQEGFEIRDSSEVGFRLLNIKTVIFRIPFSSFKVFFQPFALVCMLLRKYDLLIMMNQITRPETWINLILGRLLGKPICLWGHGISKRDGAIAVKLRKILMRLAHANILYSKSGRNKAITMGIAPGKLFVAYNALDTKKARTIKQEATPDKIEEFKSIHNLNDKKVILFIGRLLEYKRPDVLIEAMPHIVRKIPKAHAIIIGDGPIRGKLQTMVEALGLGNAVTFKGAIHDEKEVAYYLMSSSVTVMPAHAGLAIQHAFDYGVPIVVGDNMKEHPPEIELVKNGETGIFCKDGDANEFAEAICHLLTNDEERQRMSDNCRKLVEGKYNLTNMVNGFLCAIDYCPKS